MKPLNIPFVGPEYQARSLNADAQRSVNCYLEYDNESPRAPRVLYGRPGLPLEFTSNDGPQRNCIAQGDYVYLVAGQTVFRLTVDTAGLWSAYTMTPTIGTNSGPVGLASNGTQVLIVDGTGAWLAEGTALSPITDPDFPVGVTQATCLNGFFVVTGDGSQRFYWSEEPGSGTAWNGLDFASAANSPDNTVTCITNHSQLYLFGAYSAEPWYYSGEQSQPFAPTNNANIDIGTASAETVKALDNTLFWLGASLDGAGVVYRLNGYTPQRISTHAVEKAIQGYSTITDAFAWVYEQEGHSFYVLTFPTADRTWVYDVSTGQWFEWAWRDPNQNTLHRWRPVWHVYFKGKHLVGDWENAKVYSLDLDTYTDDTTPILRLRATQCLNAAGLRLFVQSLQVDMETGVGLVSGQGSNPLLMLRYSKDGGHSWSNIKTRSIGAIGRYAARVKFGPMGAGRNWVFEVSLTDPVKFALIGAFAEVEAGES